MLGHASVAITLDIYSHVLPDMQQVRCCGVRATALLLIQRCVTKIAAVFAAKGRNNKQAAC
jgi:hypothetical protein